MRVHHLNCGTMCPPFARLVNGSGGLFERARMVCHCLLVEGRDGLALVDTGLGTADVADPRGRLGPGFAAMMGGRFTAGDAYFFRGEVHLDPPRCPPLLARFQSAPPPPAPLREASRSAHMN